MSEPLEFDAETRALHDALFPNEYRHARPFLIHAALREAAAKALMHAIKRASTTYEQTTDTIDADKLDMILDELLGLESALRAAEQPPTPPSGRGEERERIEDIRDAHTGRLTYLKINGFRLSATDEHIRDLLAAVDSRDAVIAALVDAAWYARTWRWDDPDGLPKDACQKIDAALLAARPFTKEPR